MLRSRCGYPSAARAAGSALADCPETLPWWRVVYADGQLTALQSQPTSGSACRRGSPAQGPSGDLVSPRTVASASDPNRSPPGDPPYEHGFVKMERMERWRSGLLRLAMNPLLASIEKREMYFRTGWHVLSG